MLGLQGSPTHAKHNTAPSTMVPTKHHHAINASCTKTPPKLLFFEFTGHALVMSYVTTATDESRM